MTERRPWCTIAYVQLPVAIAIGILKSWRGWWPLTAGLALTACLGPQSLDQPLSPLVVRSELVGRTVVGTEDGQTFTVRLWPNGIAARSAPAAAEFGRWRTGANGALCLWWHEEGERCAPVYAAGGSHYRWGDTELSVLGAR